MQSFEASSSLDSNNVMICTTLKRLNPSNYWSYKNGIMLFNGKLLNGFMVARQSIQNPQTGTRKQQHHLTVRTKIPLAEMFVKLVHISSLTLHPPCSHWGNMLCLSKLTTSSLQQSQQTCMGTYLSKIEDSAYPLTMTKVSGSTHLVKIKMSCYMSCKSMKADDGVKWQDRTTYRNRFVPGGEKIYRHWMLGKSSAASCCELWRTEACWGHE